MTPIYQYGKMEPFLVDGSREISRMKGDVDALNETWHHTASGQFMEDRPHPLFPGMIIDQVRERMIGPACYTSQLVCLGSFGGDRATKVLSTSDMISLEATWDEFSIEYLTWQSTWRDCTAEAATDVITTAVPHTFVKDQPVMFRNKSGGAGLTALSLTSRGTVYYVRDVTALTFKAAATAGGSAVDVTSDMTAGQVCAREFVPGHAHWTMPNMYACDIQRVNQETDWWKVRVSYKGMMGAKPYKRIITSNGQTVSSGGPIVLTLPDGWALPQYSQVNIPKVQLVDYILDLNAPATEEVPRSEGEGGTAFDPPSIRSISLTADSDSLTYHWPNGWSKIAEETVDSIPLAGVYLRRRVHEYNWPVTFR